METVAWEFADLPAIDAASGTAKAGDAKTAKLRVNPRALRTYIPPIFACIRAHMFYSMNM
jgi:hypothetical protein